MCEGSFLPSSFGPHQKHTEFESSLRSYPINSFAFFAKGWGLFREVEGNLLSRVFPQPISAMPLKQILFTPRASASLARGRLTQPFRAMSHVPHSDSAGAEYFSPARERWVEISHDRVLQGRHNHVLCLRFRVFFAKTSSRGAAGVPHFSPLLREVGDRPLASHPRQAS